MCNVRGAVVCSLFFLEDLKSDYGTFVDLLVVVIVGFLLWHIRNIVRFLYLTSPVLKLHWDKLGNFRMHTVSTASKAAVVAMLAAVNAVRGTPADWVDRGFSMARVIMTAKTAFNCSLAENIVSKIIFTMPVGATACSCVALCLRGVAARVGVVSQVSKHQRVRYLVPKLRLELRLLMKSSILGRSVVDEGAVVARASMDATEIGGGGELEGCRMVESADISADVELMTTAIAKWWMSGRPPVCGFQVCWRTTC